MPDTITDVSNSTARAASFQLIWLGITATLGFALLMVLLSWASALTGSSTRALSAIDVETGPLTLQ